MDYLVVKAIIIKHIEDIKRVLSLIGSINNLMFADYEKYLYTIEWNSLGDIANTLILFLQNARKCYDKLERLSEEEKDELNQLQLLARVGFNVSAIIKVNTLEKSIKYILNRVSEDTKENCNKGEQ